MREMVMWLQPLHRVGTTPVGHSSCNTLSLVVALGELQGLNDTVSFCDSKMIFGLVGHTTGLRYHQLVPLAPLAVVPTWLVPPTVWQAGKGAVQVGGNLQIRKLLANPQTLSAVGSLQQNNPGR